MHPPYTCALHTVIHTSAVLLCSHSHFADFNNGTGQVIKVTLELNGNSHMGLLAKHVSATGRDMLITTMPTACDGGR